MKKALGGLLVVVGALLACSSEVTGTLTVNGSKFDIAECRSGEAYTPQFPGVEFQNASGEKVRFVTKPSGGFTLYHFKPGQGLGTLVGSDCGTVTVQTTNTKINDVSNIQGSVNANCTGGGVSVVAAVNYAKCH